MSIPSSELLGHDLLEISISIMTRENVGRIQRYDLLHWKIEGFWPLQTKVSSKGIRFKGYDDKLPREVSQPLEQGFLVS